MHDVQLEDRLRRALRQEADTLPFTITADQIEIRLAARRRAAFNQRLAILAAAGLAVVAVGVGAFLLNQNSEEVVTPTPSPTVLPSPSAPPSASVPPPSESPAPSEAPSPAPTTPLPSTRTTTPIGAANDAVLVKFIGTRSHPDRIDVSLIRFDAGAFETNPQPRPLVSFEMDALTANFVFSGSAPKVSPDGWLAVGVTDPTTGDQLTLVYDLRDANKDAWGAGGPIEAAAWGPGAALAAVDERTMYVGYAGDRLPSFFFEIPPDVSVRKPDADSRQKAPQWLADGSGFLAWRGNEFGRLSLDGSFEPADVPAPQFQVSGVERQWGADGSEMSTGCPTEGGPPGCSVSNSIGGGPATAWYVTDSGLGNIVEDAWDAEGNGLWLVVNRTSVSRSTFVLMHADAPNEFIDIAEFNVELDAEGNFPFLVGIRDAEPTADDQLFLFGTHDSAGSVVVALSADGARASDEDFGQFAGWAANQPAYPVP